MTKQSKAYKFAKLRHEGQFRRDGVTPYFNHCEAVAKLLDTELEKDIAYCHDLLEDDRATYAELEKATSTEIADAVYVLSHKHCHTYNEYISFIPKKYISIKIADMVANIMDNPTDKQVKKYLNAMKLLISK